MSLKHKQFQDSIIGRSYVKIAQDNGWIPEASLKKEALAPDLQATSILMENIIKLCQGLRQTGFDKYAAELETKFLKFKEADCHYDVSGEKGEDLIDAAHPEGSHQLKDVEGDESIIETILDQHMKILKKIEKMPHGKLSNAKEIINAVKVVLAQQGYDAVKAQLDAAYSNAYAAYNAAATAGKLSAPTVFWIKDQVIDLSELVLKSANEVSLNDINDALVIVQKLRNAVKPGLHMLKGIADPAVLQTVNSYLDASKQNLTAASDLIKELVTGVSKPKPVSQEHYTTIAPVTLQGFANPVLKNVEERAQNLMDNLDSYKLVGTVAKHPQALKYVDDQKSELSGFLTRLYQIKPEQQNSLAPQMQSELEKIEADVDQFERDWVKGGK